jgi:hypothetical protein
MAAVRVRRAMLSRNMGHARFAVPLNFCPCDYRHVAGNVRRRIIQSFPEKRSCPRLGMSKNCLDILWAPLSNPRENAIRQVNGSVPVVNSGKTGLSKYFHNCLTKPKRLDIKRVAGFFVTLLTIMKGESRE